MDHFGIKYKYLVVQEFSNNAGGGGGPRITEPFMVIQVELEVVEEEDLLFKPNAATAGTVNTGGGGGGSGVPSGPTLVSRWIWYSNNKV